MRFPCMFTLLWPLRTSSVLGHHNQRAHTHTQVLGITTNGLVFTGLIGLSIWAFFLVFFLILWFKILPDYFTSKGEKPDWLQVAPNPTPVAARWRWTRKLCCGGKTCKRRWQDM
jgi:hypothetical protein